MLFHDYTLSHIMNSLPVMNYTSDQSNHFLLFNDLHLVEDFVILGGNLWQQEREKKCSSAI